ncbi:hypothetical protein QJS04_geneDACA013161 [Acorus gramineus]|uniref:Wall-associated receptor kinase galacturonan-binding domain-containing protein n=1 Tax=Acorus gramineus TaxID=55184 RepID=A0AAV9B995_ACOGR|nr:hypothetical protein QJS04_geneDACA013161 [Acorus gramineus]
MGIYSSITTPTITLLHLLILFHLSHASSPCRHTCGSIPLQYPFGTGYGCGSPRFHPSITCSPDGNLLLLTTHTGSYPITSINYASSTLTISPPFMSTCSSMHATSTTFGLDWAGPFQLGPSIFVLLSCPPPTSSLTYKSFPVCDTSVNAHLCLSLYTCPSVLSLGLPLFSPTNTCCVYSPASLGPKGDLDLQGLRCLGYVSVLSLGDFPTDANKWKYGIALKYSQPGFNGFDASVVCGVCEMSEGVCGYVPPKNYFVCVCKNGANTTTDCYGQEDLCSCAGRQNIITNKCIHFSVFGEVHHCW